MMTTPDVQWPHALRRRKLLSAVALLTPLSHATAQPSGASAPHAGETAPKQPKGPVATVHPSLHLVGDSTMSDKPLGTGNPERGWGQALRARMKDPRRLLNHAVNGRSGRRFRAEGRWDHLLRQLAPGDHVLIQFGHNDQKVEDPSRYAEADTDYRQQLRRFVAEARAAAAEVLLATSVVRRKFDTAGRILPTLGEYPRVTREVAAELGVPLLDLNRSTQHWLEHLGPEASKAMFMWLPPATYPTHPQGLQDDTHFVAAGAQAVADMAIQQIQQLEHPLAAWFTSP